MPALVSRFRHFHPDPREFKNNILPCPKPFLELKEPWLMLAVPFVVGFYWMVMSFYLARRMFQTPQFLEADAFNRKRRSSSNN